MKLNLPTTWTSQKISTLFLLTLAYSLNKVEGGSQFSSCLGAVNYQNLVSFGINIPDKERFCCCPNTPLTPSCPYTGWPKQFDYVYNGQCNSIGQVEFCVTHDHTETSSPVNLCGGILGNVSSDAVAGNCPSPQAVANILAVQKTTPIFSWLCCDNNNCFVPPNVVVTGATANTNCTAGQYSMMCFQDDGAWTCTGSIGTNISDIAQPIGDCVLQISNSSINSRNFSSAKANHIVPITVGTGAGLVGVGSVGGLTYYLIKTGHLKSLLKIIKPKTKVQKKQGKNVNVEIELLAVTGEEGTVGQLKQKELPIPPIKVHLSNLSNKKNSSLVSLSPSYYQIIEQIKSHLDPEGQEFLYSFLDAQDTFYNSNERTRAGAERQFQRAKQMLGTKVNWNEIESLEKSYWQNSEQQYQSQIELANSSQTRLI